MNYTLILCLILLIVLIVQVSMMSGHVATVLDLAQCPLTLKKTDDQGKVYCDRGLP